MLVYGDMKSGNCLKVKLILSFLDIEHDWQHVDILKGETKMAEFLAVNPNGKIPVVVLDDGRVLSESNAILGYFAEGTSYLPTDNFLKAKVYEWLFFEQYSHEPFIAVARFIQKYQGMPKERVDEYHSLQSGGHKALKLMERQLGKSAFLVGDTMTIADISLYAYTHVAHEGGFSLENYPNIARWIDTIANTERYVGIS
ncbi:glutathione S-transferase family protein [Grimontia sp. NTOU-MAR1]|uniref:glutathione S-transferase family protein n=1 Tax=Grimontia sp. NTOU-MAR1 TaxID=3111011 RepID=UPI002DB5A06B|nr:glutathione S-transferase family protein [Grimontia sp. NTOU-MAR1]WRV99672.1 glutathione S-transferase family protein [Grimontia sp. NTOU-MAR1]